VTGEFAEEKTSLNRPGKSAQKQAALLKEVYEAISTGAEAFLRYLFV
jgi:hypothetical protein